MNWEDIFQYENGKLYWKIRNSNRTKIGQEAGTLTRQGYIQILYRKKHYQAHRIVWELHNGDIPTNMQIDHINHIRHDNRIENLRLVSNSDNHKNRKLSPKNTSGITGVYWDKGVEKFKAQIQVDGNYKYLGHFDTIEDAKQARKQAEEHYRFHANHGLDA